MILVYSQTQSFAWDEGFHLLAAQLIDHGQLPYVDYCFPQTPLNAFWVAFWMHHIFGELARGTRSGLARRRSVQSSWWATLY